MVDQSFTDYIRQMRAVGGLLTQDEYNRFVTLAMSDPEAIAAVRRYLADRDYRTRLAQARRERAHDARIERVRVELEEMAASGDELAAWLLEPIGR